jgi:hypothetical protein
MKQIMSVEVKAIIRLLEEVKKLKRDVEVLRGVNRIKLYGVCD